MVGGGLMFAVGAIYLAFQEKILANANTRNGSIDAKTNVNSRLILSVQVRHAHSISHSPLTVYQLGLVLLSMIVTKRSIHYIQARQGLPLGVLVVGWATLGKAYLRTLQASTDMLQRAHSFSPASTAFTQTAITSIAWW